MFHPGKATHVTCDAHRRAKSAQVECVQSIIACKIIVDDSS